MQGVTKPGGNAGLFVSPGGPRSRAMFPPVLRRLLLALCAVVLMQETALGSLFVGAECFESCPDDTTPGHCPPTCATCGCGSHLNPVTPRPVRVASPASSECRPSCEAALPPADSHVADILHVPKALLA